MLLIDLLGALLIAGLASWLAVRFLMDRRALQARRRGWSLVALGAFNTVTFLTAFVFSTACAERFRAITPVDPGGQEQSARSAAPDASWRVTPMMAPRPETEQQERYRGYHAGYDLGTDPRHRGSRVPTSWALDAIVNLRCKGQGPIFSDGYRHGYLAGIASREVTRSGP